MDANNLPRYRVLTGVDDAEFCKRVSAALDLGYELYGSASITWTGTSGYLAQAIIWTKDEPTPQG